MDIIDNIIEYFKAEDTEEKKISPEGTCPICWGHQNYDGQIRELLSDKQIDVNNHKASYMLIEDFVKTNIDGIKLKESITVDCPSCQPETPGKKIT